MAKKPKKEAVKPTEEKSPLTTAKEAVVKAAGKVAAVASQAAEAVKEHVVEPVVKAVKPKKKRFVREKKASAPQDNAPAMPKPSKKVAAKLMTKGLVAPPKEDPKTGQKPKA